MSDLNIEEDRERDAFSVLESELLSSGGSGSSEHWDNSMHFVVLSEMHVLV